jgi:hypothetical protein
MCYIVTHRENLLDQYNFGLLDPILTHKATRFRIGAWINAFTLTQINLGRADAFL